MKRLVTMIVLLSLGCGTEDSSSSRAHVHMLDGNQTHGTLSSALELRPEIQPEGLDSLYSRVEVTDLTFFGALHLVPVYEANNVPAASTAFKFELSGGTAVTTTTGRPLKLERPGRYTVLMTIHPMGGKHSVNMSGSVLQNDDNEVSTDGNSCRGEAAPVTADEGEMEAAPTTADQEDEMEAAPITADEGVMEAAPTTANTNDEMEAAPTTADEEDQMEAAPITADEGVMEAAPTTADCGMTDGRDYLASVCQWEDRFTASNKFSAQSEQSFEFDLGVVHIKPSDVELFLYWNMSDWVALLMGNELGLSFAEMLELHEALVDESNTDEEFTPDAVRIETN